MQLQPNLTDTKALVQILGAHTTRTVPKGEVPFTPDETLRYFYFIADGRIKISQIHPQTAKEQTLQILARGDMFDLITLLDATPHDYTATALEESRIVQVPIAQVRNLIQNDPAFYRYFFPYLARQMRQMEALAVDLSLYDVYERILRLLGRNLHEEDNAHHLDLINDLSHEELAALVGTVRKVLNRSLQKLKDEGIIDISRKQLNIKDLEKLLDKIEELS